MPDRSRLVRERERAAKHIDQLTAQLAAALAERGISLTRAPSAAAAADRVAALAAGACVAVTRAAVVGELYAALRERDVEVVPTYGPAGADFDPRWRRFWQLPPRAPSTNWSTRPVLEQGEGRRDVVGLFGVNAVSAATGSVFLLQHSNNIGDLLRAARLRLFVVGVDKIASDDEAARLQVEAASTFGADSVLLDLARTPPLVNPLDRFSPTSGSPGMEVILLDNGRTDLLGGRYRSLFTCIGCRACATRCPTYPDFRGARGWNPKDYLWSHLRGDNSSLEMCTFCGNCEVDCPLDIPLPTLIAQRRAESIAVAGRGPAGRRRRVQAEVERLGKVLSATAPASGFALRLPLATAVTEKVFGLARQRPLPVFHSDTFERRHAGRSAVTPRPQGPGRPAHDEFRAPREGYPTRTAGDGRPANRGRPGVVYYFGCFANYNDPEVGGATVATLESLGYDVILPAWRCCGIPLYAKGEVAAARRMAAANVTALSAYVDAGHEVVTSCPSCQLALARDYPRLFPSPAAERVAAHTHFLSRFLLDADGLEGLLGTVAGRGAYHLPCHLRALGMDGDSLRLLGKIAGLRVDGIDRGCCGLSGTFGLESAHYAASMEIGAGLFAAVTATDFDFVLTDCGACKLQIEHGTGRKVAHPAQLVARAIASKSGLADIDPARDAKAPAALSPGAAA